MTGAQIVDLDRFLQAARDLNGKITMLRQRITWLSDKVRLRIYFDRSHPDYSPVGGHTECPLGRSEDAIRSMLLSQAEAELAVLEDEFAKFQLPG